MQGCSLRGLRAPTPIRFCLAAIAAASLHLAGCTTPPPPATFNSAVSRYEEGRYQQALDQGIQLAKAQGGVASQQASLVAAMSAYKLGKLDQAQLLAQVASTCADSPTAGAALVLLGDIALARHNPEQAVDLFERAATKLSAADAAHARDCAARSRDLIEPTKAALLGAIPDPEPPTQQPLAVAPAPKPQPAPPTAKREVAVAPAASQTPPSQAPPSQPKTAPAPVEVAAAPSPKATPEGTSGVQAPSGVEAAKPAADAVAVPASGRTFTIRAGSYTTKAAAEKRAKSLAADTKRANAPSARVDEIRTPKGEDLFAVRIGSWSTRAEAEKVMVQIGRRDLMVGAFDKDN